VSKSKKNANAGAIHLAKAPRMRPSHLEHQLTVSPHLRMDEVSSGLVKILPTDRKQEQPADFLTKPLDAASFVKHLKTVLGW
jgi:hypothetical protein